MKIDAYHKMENKLLEELSNDTLIDTVEYSGKEMKKKLSCFAYAERVLEKNKKLEVEEKKCVEYIYESGLSYVNVLVTYPSKTGENIKKLEVNAIFQENKAAPLVTITSSCDYMAIQQLLTNDVISPNCFEDSERNIAVYETRIGFDGEKIGNSRFTSIVNKANNQLLAEKYNQGFSMKKGTDDDITESYVMGEIELIYNQLENPILCQASSEVQQLALAKVGFDTTTTEGREEIINHANLEVEETLKYMGNLLEQFKVKSADKPKELIKK